MRLDAMGCTHWEAHSYQRELIYVSLREKPFDTKESELTFADTINPILAEAQPDLIHDGEEDLPVTTVTGVGKMAASFGVCNCVLRGGWLFASGTIPRLICDHRRITLVWILCRG